MADIVIASMRRAGVQAPEGYIKVPCDRRSVLGNPFVMHIESQRGQVCDQYHNWLFKQHEERNPAVNQELQRLITMYREGKNIALTCWCAPKRCHCESIKSMVISLA